MEAKDLEAYQASAAFRALTGLALFMIDGDQEQPPAETEKRSGIVARLAATNKCSAQRNKTRTGPKLTSKPTGSEAYFGAATGEDPVAG